MASELATRLLYTVGCMHIKACPGHVADWHDSSCAGEALSQYQSVFHSHTSVCMTMGMATAAAASYPAPGTTGVLGSYAYWGPKAGAQVFSLNPEGADLKFGAVTVATGVVGTILGGVALDRLGSSMRNALGICCVSNVLG